MKLNTTSNKQASNTLVKVILVTRLLALAATPAIANDWFIDGSIGSQKNTFEESVHSGKNPPVADDYAKKYHEHDAVYSVRFGKLMGDNNEHRVYSTCSYSDGNAGDLGGAKYRQQNILFSYDYIVPIGQTDLNWFVGATAGYGHTRVHDEMGGSKDGFIYGGQTGFQYNLNESMTAELGYRYIKEDYEKVAVSGSNTETLALDDSQQFYLGIDYRF